MTDTELKELNNKLCNLTVIRIEDGEHRDQVNLTLGDCDGAEAYLLACFYGSGDCGWNLTDMSKDVT